MEAPNQNMGQVAPFQFKTTDPGTHDEARGGTSFKGLGTLNGRTLEIEVFIPTKDLVALGNENKLEGKIQDTAFKTAQAFILAETRYGSAHSVTYQEGKSEILVKKDETSQVKSKNLEQLAIKANEKNPNILKQVHYQVNTVATHVLKKDEQAPKQPSLEEKQRHLSSLSNALKATAKAVKQEEPKKKESSQPEQPPASPKAMSAAIRKEQFAKPLPEKPVGKKPETPNATPMPAANKSSKKEKPLPPSREGRPQLPSRSKKDVASPPPPQPSPPASSSRDAPPVPSREDQKQTEAAPRSSGPPPAPPPRSNALPAAKQKEESEGSSIARPPPPPPKAPPPPPGGPKTTTATTKKWATVEAPPPDSYAKTPDTTVSDTPAPEVDSQLKARLGNIRKATKGEEEVDEEGDSEPVEVFGSASEPVKQPEAKKPENPEKGKMDALNIKIPRPPTEKGESSLTDTLSATVTERARHLKDEPSVELTPEEEKKENERWS